MIASVTRGIKRRAGHRKFFADGSSWRLSVYDAIVRYAKRFPLPSRGQLRSIQLAGLPDPVFMRVGSSDGFVIEEVFVAGVYDSVTKSDLGDVNTVVDLGANAGYSVRLWMNRYPRAKVIAVEPDDGNLATLRANVDAAKGRDRVTIDPVCVAGEPGVVYLDRSAEECAIHVTDTPIGKPVPAKTLEQILEQAGVTGRIDLLKCDIEGAEESVFAKCGSWIDRVGTIVIELHGAYGQPQLMRDLSQGPRQWKILWSGNTAGNKLLFLRPV